MLLGAHSEVNFYGCLLGKSVFRTVKEQCIFTDRTQMHGIRPICFYSSADDRLKERREAAIVVGSNGEVMWMPQAILRSSCSFDTTYFPFDKQNCSLKFASWSYDGTTVDLHFFQNLTKFSLASYMKGTEWDIVENHAKRSEYFYECCPDMPYPDLTFYIVIQRKVAFYSFILILPCALLSLLTLVIFWVPPESPAKLVLGEFDNNDTVKRKF